MANSPISTAETIARRGLGRYGKDFLFGPDSIPGRRTRGSGFITIVEMAIDAYVELDADSAGHGCRLARLWLGEGFRGMSASVWRVEAGRLVDQLALLG